MDVREASVIRNGMEAFKIVTIIGLAILMTESQSIGGMWFRLSPW